MRELQNNKRDFKGIWIPAKVWLNTDLTIMEKIILLEIDSLDGPDGCYANNQHFADFCDISKSRASQIINQLEKKGYVEINIIRNENKQVVRRIIKSLMHEKIFGLSQETKQGVYQKVKGVSREVKQPPLENCEYKNTSYKNTKEKYVYSEVDKNLKKISQLYQNNIGVINGIVAEDLKTISQEVSVELFEEAIRIATDKGKSNFGYIKGILNQWRKNNIKTLDDLKEKQPAKRKTTQRDKMKQEGHYGSKLNAKTVERTLKAEEIKKKFGL